MATDNYNTRVSDKEIETGIADGKGGIYSEDGKRLLKYTGDNAEYAVRDGVEVICDHAFNQNDYSHNETLQKLTLPSSLKAVGFRSFIGVEGIVSESDAFQVRDHMLLDATGTSLIYYFGTDPVVMLPDYVKSISRGAIDGNAFIKELTLPASVESLQYNAINSCPALEKITIENPAMDCDGGIGFFRNLKAIVIPPKTKGKYGKDFKYLKDLLVLAKPVKKTAGGKNADAVGDDGKYTKDGKKLTKYSGDAKTYSVREGTAVIGKGAFKKNLFLESITLPATVTAIEESAFEGCPSLAEIVLPASLTEIGVAAFSGCSSLKSIALPGGVTIINRDTFKECVALEKATIASGTTTVGGFTGCKALKEIKLPASVTKIEFSAFDGCINLEKVTLCKGLKEIGGHAFQGCHRLQEINIPDTVETIDSYAFKSCSKLRRITLPAALKELSRNPFIGMCAEVDNHSKTHRVEDNVIYSADGTRLLAYLSDDPSFTVPESVTVIGDEAFRQNGHIETVYLHAGIEEIGLWAFSAPFHSNVFTIYIPPKTKDKFAPMLEDDKKYLKVLK